MAAQDVGRPNEAPAKSRGSGDTPVAPGTNGFGPASSEPEIQFGRIERGSDTQNRSVKRSEEKLVTLRVTGGGVIRHCIL